MWSNAYINDVSINNNLQVTGNVYISENLEASNIYTKAHIDNSFTNVYTIAEFDNSYSNVYTRDYIDLSFANIYTRGHIDQSFANVYTIGEFDNSYANVYTRDYIDLSFANVYTRGYIDQSFANVYTKAYIDTSFQNVYTIGEFDNSYANVYTRGHIDQSFADIYTRGRIDQSFANVYTKSQVDASFVTKSLFELSYNALLAIRGSGSGGTSVNSNIIPSSTNTYNLGSTSKYWNNTYINNLRVSNRVYQEISGDISWSAVNGYYGLAKDAYPSLNPYSNGALAVSSWTNITIQNLNVQNWTSICWSPKLRLFLAVSTSTSNNLITSQDGRNWNVMTLARGEFAGTFTDARVTWSNEVEKFVAVSTTSTNNLMYSSDGTNWTYISIAFGQNFRQVTWSPELGIFLALFSGPGSDGTYISNNGTTWTLIPAGSITFKDSITLASLSIYTISHLSMCWSGELGLFVGVGESGNYRIFYSNNGKNWLGINTTTFGNPSYRSICWSKQLGLFVAVSNRGTYRVSISNNGTTWTNIDIGSFTLCTVSWSAELELFIALTNNGIGFISSNGINWSQFNAPGGNFYSSCWSPELGLFVATGINNALATSSLKGRPPTSYNVFDSSFNRIDENGKWDFSNIAVATLNVTGTFTNTSDDRLKHNEVAIVNGLAVIDRLTPKFYQKTQVMLDTSYNGDLSGQAWTYEAGLIAQEVLQIPDLSFAVSGGDYYQESYILKNQSNDISTNYYDYDISANYDICYNLIKQPYSLNYNSVFVYGVAAIKELHTKVKAQETNVLDEQLNNLITRIETMETASISPQQ
jgi:hypothetical protein